MPALAAEYVVWPIEPCIPAPEEVLITRATALATLLGLAAPPGAGVPQRREVALEVDPDDGVPLLLGGVHQHPVADEPGVVDQDVETAEGVDRLLHHRRGLLEVGDVGAVGDGLAAERLDLGDDLVRDLGGRALAGARGAEVVDDDLGALAGELERVRAADAPAGAGDDRDASFEQGHWFSFCTTCRLCATRKAGGSPPPWHSTEAPET